ncbi:MAG: hypothetical protein MJZ76_03345 [Bacteroidales bacterium]|nr:hypothetical protein [Bacteroidales bacterium]
MCKDNHFSRWSEFWEHYNRLPPLKYWKVNKKPQGPDFYVVAILDNDDVVKEYGYAFNWNKFDSNEIVGRGLKYKLLPHEAFGDQRMFEWMDGKKHKRTRNLLKLLYF